MSEEIEKEPMVDNLGNEIKINDLVYCLSGKNKNTIQRVTSYRYVTNPIWENIDNAVNMTGHSWAMVENVVSLTALGFTQNPHPEEGCYHDALGNSLHEGDAVLFKHSKEMFMEEGIIKKLSPQTCLLAIEQNRFGKTEYRCGYDGLLSLSAIHKEGIETRSHYR